jgi:hypothetical protein
LRDARRYRGSRWCAAFSGIAPARREPKTRMETMPGPGSSD